MFHCSWLYYCITHYDSHRAVNYESQAGIFFLTRPFDPSKLKFNVIELFGEKLIGSVFYRGEEVSLECTSNIEEEHLMDIFKGA